MGGPACGAFCAVGKLAVLILRSRKTEALSLAVLPAFRADVVQLRLALAVDDLRYQAGIERIALASGALKIVNKLTANIGHIRARPRIAKCQLVNGAMGSKP